MNWERVHLIYYVYTSITVILLVLAIGKFFCVRKLYEVYNELNKIMDNSLGLTLSLLIFILVGAWIFLILGYQTFIILFVIIMVLVIFISSIWFSIIIIFYVYNYLVKYHHKIKKIKNL